VPWSTPEAHGRRSVGSSWHLPAFTSSAQSRPDERTSFTYDALDRLVSETDRLGNATHYTYDQANLTTGRQWLRTGVLV